MKKAILSILVIIIVISGGSFYIGMKYAQSKATQRFTQRSAPQNRFQGGRTDGQFGSGFVTGDIIFKDDKSITVQLRNSGSKIIFYSDLTEVGKFVDGTINDLEVGKTITVNGNANQDGSITAQSIQIRSKAANQSR